MQNKTYPALRRRLFGVLLVMSLAPLCALGWFCIDRINALHADKVAISLDSVARNKARAVDTFLSERTAQIQTLAATYSFNELTNPQRLRMIFTTMQRNSKSYTDIGIIGRNGRHITYVGPYSIIHSDYSQEKWFHEVLAKGVYISNVFMGFRHEPHFIIAVLQTEGDKSYIIRASIDLAVINALVHRPANPTAKTSFTDAFIINDKMILQTSTQGQGEIMTAVDLALPLPENSVPLLPRAVRNDTSGQEYLAAVVPITNMPWFLVVLEDASQALAPLRQLRLMVIIFMLGGAMLMSAGAAFAAYSMVSRLEALDRKQAQIDAQMIQSSKMAALGKMATGIAHEINNPLTLIRESAGWINDLLGDEAPEHIKNYKEITETAVKIEQHVDRAKNITHRMLGFARANTASQSCVQLPALIDQSIAFLHSEAVQRNITITTEFAPDLVPITTDANQLQQVLLNIIDNALDAIDANGTVSICAGSCLLTHNGEKGCYITIHDTGKGMSEQTMAHIFDPFFTTKKPGEGTGLGLAICFTILKTLGGHMDVTSKAGAGSTFRITLPCTPPPVEELKENNG